MMRSNVRRFAVIIAIVGTSNAFAKMSTYPCGWYLEGNYGESRVTGQEYPGVASKDEDGAGWNVNGGYKFMPYFGVDVGYTSYANVSLKNSEGTTEAQGKHFSINGALKGILPIPKFHTELFAKAGVAWISAQVTNVDDAATAIDDVTLNTDTKTRTGPYFGGGAALVLAPELLANVQWTRAMGNDSTGKHLDLLSLGFTILFS